MSNEIKEEKIEISGIGAFGRDGVGNYPIFSLRKDDPLIIDEFRELLARLNVEWTEHDLPGEEVPEKSERLGSQIHTWSTRPRTKPLPEGVFLRTECRIRPIAVVERFMLEPGILFTASDVPREACYTFLNVQTGETAELRASRKTKTHTFSKDMSKWEVVSMIDVNFT